MAGKRKHGVMETTRIGTNIRSLRERKAWTQEQLAGAARVALRTVQRAEEGTMSAETKAAIAGALDVPVEKLDAEACPTIQPILMYEDSRAAVDWLVTAFGFAVRERVTNEDGQVVHGELVLGGGVVGVTLA
jgi:transcriptional regulator with XRE-family HTH domain